MLKNVALGGLIDVFPYHLTNIGAVLGAGCAGGTMSIMVLPEQPTPRTARATRRRSARRGRGQTGGAAPPDTGFVASVRLSIFINALFPG